jgi:hypothetical protein
MTDLLDDRDNLVLLENLISGEAVSVNLSTLSRALGKHRNTIKVKVDSIFKHDILHRPIYPFLGLYRICPLLVVIQLDIPRNPLDRERFERWVQEDQHIFAAYRARQGEYDTLLFVYHQSITSFQLWMNSLPAVLKLQYNLSEEAANFVSSASYFSNERMIKYEPSSGLRLMEEDFVQKGELTINDYKLDEVDLAILQKLVAGEGIKTNFTILCAKTGLHRKTAEKRVAALLKDRWVGSPVCRFPNFFVPPNYVLTYSLYEIRKSKERVIREIRQDSHIPISYEIMLGKYNMLLFGNYRTLSDHLRWEDEYVQKFPDAIGSASITYLSPEMTIAFDHQIVSLGIIQNRLKSTRGRKLREALQVSPLPGT